MAAPFPYDSVAGVADDAAERDAAHLYANYKWIARLVDQLNDATDLDLKQVMQLVFHSRQFRLAYDSLQARISAGTHTQTQIGDILQGVFLLKKCSWATRAAMNSDLSTIYNTAGTVADWIEANASNYKEGYSVNKEVSPGVMTDEPIKIAKPTGVATRIANFRSLFGAKA